MKKILCLILALAFLFCFAACGSKKASSDAKTESKSGTESTDASVKITAIVFDAENYDVAVDGDFDLSAHITVTPADGKAIFSIDDTNIATVTKKGIVTGGGSGTATVTAASEDGSVTATCKITVSGAGKIVARDTVTMEGGITNKRFGYVESSDDTDAYVVIVSKSIAGTSMPGAASLDIGDNGAKSFAGYYVAKTNERGEYSFEGVPEGDYIGIIFSSKDYTANKDYSSVDTKADIKATALGKIMTSADIDAMVDKLMSLNNMNFKHEFHVAEFSVKANQSTVFGCDFRID